MRRLFGSALLGAGLVFAALAGRGVSQGSVGPALSAAHTQFAGAEVMTHLADADGQPLALTVIDSRQQWIGVYHVDRASGEITLKSARKYTWDAQLTDYHTSKPLPQEIRSGLPR